MGGNRIDAMAGRPAEQVGHLRTIRGLLEELHSALLTSEYAAATSDERRVYAVATRRVTALRNDAQVLEAVLRMVVT